MFYPARMSRRLVAVHAHPDDESLTMAVTLGRAVAAGVAVTLVTATLGEEGEVIGDELRGLTAEQSDQLGGYRLTELRAACDALGVGDQRQLGGVGAFRDSGMAGSPSARHPRAFVRAAPGGPDHDRAVTALVRVLDEVRPDAVLTYDADGGYGHPDHVTTHEVTVAAVGAANWRVARTLAVVRPRAAAAADLAALVAPPEYPRAAIDQLGFLVADDVVDVAVEADGREHQRATALAAHATQIELFPGGFALSNRLAQPLPRRECYRVLLGVPVLGPRPVADPFAGLE